MKEFLEDSKRIRNCWKGKFLGKTAILNIHARNTEVQNRDLMIHFTRERTPSCRESYFWLGTSYLLRTIRSGKRNNVSELPRYRNRELRLLLPSRVAEAY